MNLWTAQRAGMSITTDSTSSTNGFKKTAMSQEDTEQF